MKLGNRFNALKPMCFKVLEGPNEGTLCRGVLALTRCLETGQASHDPVAPPPQAQGGGADFELWGHAPGRSARLTYYINRGGCCVGLCFGLYGLCLGLRAYGLWLRVWGLGLGSGFFADG